MNYSNIFSIDNTHVSLVGVIYSSFYVALVQGKVQLYRLEKIYDIVVY